jgi:GNAT superfamily N-acetyltransferase
MSKHSVQVFTTAPATPNRWEDLVSVMGLRGDPSWCWCQHFRFRGKAWAETTTAGNREQLRQQVAAGPPAPGVLAYLAEEPVGWCAVGSKPAYPRLMASRISSPTARSLEAPDVAGAWAVSCFVVRKEQRRRGVSAALLGAAVEYAAANGASMVEGYPVDPSATKSVSGAGLFHGALSVFLAAGFTEVHRPTPARVLVRKQL